MAFYFSKTQKPKWEKYGARGPHAILERFSCSPPVSQYTRVIWR